jgi:hypothetical protein
MINRSQFIEELRRNPNLVRRIAVITAGEVGGNAPIEKQIIQAETIFNRAIARDQTLEQVTRDLVRDPRGGYYPGSTIQNGERIMGRQGALEKFREQVFKPVLGGSDVGTEKLGFAPTGNASEGKNNFASRRAAAGHYAKSKWYGDRNSGGEMYVEEKGRLDRPERIAALRKGGAQPTTDVADASGRVTGAVDPAKYETKLLPSEEPAFQAWKQKYAPNDSGVDYDLRGAFKAGVTPDPATGHMPDTFKKPNHPTFSVESQYAKDRPDLAGYWQGNTYVAPKGKPPSTGAQLASTVRPNESAPGSAFEPTPGEQQFLVGGAEPAAPAAAAPAAAPATAIATGPTTTASARAATPPKPVGTLGEQIIKAMGPRGLDRSSYIDPNTGREILNPGGSGEEAMGITRDLGRPNATQTSRSPAARSTSPRAEPPAPAAPAAAARAEEPPVPLPRARPTLAPFDPAAIDPAQLTQQRSIDLGPRLDEGPTPPSAITAARPPQADYLSTLFKDFSRTPDRPLSAAPVTADNLSPFEPGARPKPFPQAPEMARILAAPPPPEGVQLPRSLENQSASPAFGGTRPLNMAPGRTVDQQLLGLSPFTYGGGSATQPPAAATVAPEQRAMMQPDTTDVPGQAAPVFNSVNLSPLEQWPPPWWDFGGGSYGGGGFGGGFGGGYDFGAFA